MTAQQNTPPRAIELFAGGGGLALGLGQAGFDHLALIEWWAPAAHVLRHNAELGHGLWPKDAVHQVDVRAAGPLLAGMKPDLIAGGPPCLIWGLVAPVIDVSHGVDGAGSRTWSTCYLSCRARRR